MKVTKVFLLLPVLSLMFACSGSGDDPGEKTITVSEAADEVSLAARKYDSSITSEGLLASIQALDSSIVIDSQCTYSHFFLLLNEAFSSEGWPQKTGARALEAYENEVDPIYSSYEEDSPYTAAFRFVSNAGLVNADSFGRDFNGKAPLYESDAWNILDRFHWYYATSAVDDFYSYCNYDQRIANCEDEGKTASDSVYVSNLIPRSNIVEWSKEQLVNDNDSDLFYTVFNKSLENTSGLLALRSYLDPLLESENVVSLLETMTSLHNAYGYAPLYRSISWGFRTVAEQNVYVPQSSVYVCSDAPEESVKGGTTYVSTIERFGPMFSTILGDESKGQEFVEHYADFRHLYVLSYEDNSSLEDEARTVSEDLMIGDSGISLRKVLSDIGYEGDHYWIFENEREAVSFYDLFTNENIDALKGYCIYESMRHYIPLLPEDENFNSWIFSGPIEGNRSENTSYFFQYILPYFAGGLVNYYSGTEEYAADVETIKNLYDELRNTLVEKAQTSSWLSKEGADKIKLKSDNMKYFFGNSSDKNDRNELLEIPYSELTDPDLMECITLYQKTTWENQLSRVLVAPENDFYFQCMEYAPFTANAFYMPARNGIMITMGYMAANERPSLMSQEKLLATYGWVAGHEIGHGFDTNGFKYDYGGNYNESWMSQNDRNALADFSNKFESYFDGYEVIVGIKTTGRIVLNEALADNIGLSLSLAIGKKNGFSIKGFFEEGAKAFGGYISRSTFINNEYENDSHPFGRCRINKAFGCFDDFHETFLTKEGDHMFVPEDERLVLY